MVHCGPGAPPPSSHDRGTHCSRPAPRPTWSPAISVRQRTGLSPPNLDSGTRPRRALRDRLRHARPRANRVNERIATRVHDVDRSQLEPRRDVAVLLIPPPPRQTANVVLRGTPALAP